MENTKSGILKKLFWAGVIIFCIIIGLGFQSLTEYVDNDEYVIHQSLFTGELTVWNAPGYHLQLFGKIEPYKKQGDIYLSSDKLDGGDGADVQAVRVQFPDGHADIDIYARYKLSLSNEQQKSLYENVGNENSVRALIRQQVLEAVGQVGPLMTSADAYAEKRPSIAKIAKKQAELGIFETKVTTDTTGFDKDNNPITVKLYDIRYYPGSDGITGKEVIAKESGLKEYGITFPIFSAKGMIFDDKTIALIEAKKNAKKAQQDAITAYEQGQAIVAEKKAEQEAIKIEAVTIAQKEKEVAELNAEKKFKVAEYEAKEAQEKKKSAILIAEAKKKELEIADGLSERAKYEIDARTDAIIESAKYLSQFKGPEFVVTGSGDGKGNGTGMENILMMQMMQKMVYEHVNIGMGNTK